MRRFHALALPGQDQQVELSAEVSHHLLRVTGIAPDEAVVIFDGQGGQAVAVLVDAVRGRATLRQVGQTQRVPTSQLVLLVGVCKHTAMDTVVRMATELGVQRLQPVLSERSVARGDRSSRWQRIAQSSAAQCGRADHPRVDSPVPLREGLESADAALARVVLSPRGTPAAEHGLRLLREPLAVLVGPEGGLSDAELDLALAHGFLELSLGPRVLRADTAVAAALALATQGRVD